MHIATLPPELTHLLHTLNEQQLEQLADQVWQRLELIRKTQDLQALSQFNVHDKVTFSHNGEVVSGTVIRLNRRTATIQTSNGRRWKVHPDFLHRIVQNST